MRLIDADVLKEQIENFNCKGCNHYNFVRCRACQIDDALSYIDDAPTVEDTNVPSKWISVKERLPKENEYVLAVFANGDMAVACVFERDEDAVYWRAQTDMGWESDMDFDPIYWTPLPELPEEVAQDG